MAATKKNVKKNNPKSKKAITTPLDEKFELMATEGIVAQLIIGEKIQFRIQSTDKFCVEFEKVKKNVFVPWNKDKKNFCGDDSGAFIRKIENEFTADKKYRDCLLELWTSKRRAIFILELKKTDKSDGKLCEIRMPSE